jgi:hypothetical protein
MSECPKGRLVERAHEAAAHNDWQKAYEALTQADASAPLSGPDLVFLANVAYAAGQLDVTIEVWERAYAESLAAGDRLAAAGAAVRVAFHLLLDTALLAPVRGWLNRAERLLEDQPEAQEHAWLAVVRNYERMLAGDFASARQWARRAIEIGSICDGAAAAIGRVAEARNMILSGEVRQGLASFNEAGVATVSGELDSLSTGIVYCELVCGLQALAQYDLAEEWTEAMERSPAVTSKWLHDFGPILARRTKRRWPVWAWRTPTVPKATRRALCWSSEPLDPCSSSSAIRFWLMPCRRSIPVA